MAMQGLQSFEMTPDVRLGVSTCRFSPQAIALLCQKVSSRPGAVISQGRSGQGHCYEAGRAQRWAVLSRTPCMESASLAQRES